MRIERGEASLSESARILVIDDEESIRRTLSMTLQHAGYFVDTAENGTQAIDKSAENFYNLALIDIRLPDMEGTELLTSLRETTPRMVKIILTGRHGHQQGSRRISNQTSERRRTAESHQRTSRETKTGEGIWTAKASSIHRISLQTSRDTRTRRFKG